MRTGVIIAGGYSTRFGEGDKAVASLAGTPLIRRVADRMAGVIDTLVVNCRPEQTAALRTALDGYDHPVTVAEDAECDEGPMAGIMTGLRAVETEYAFVAACDMPFLEPVLIDRLFDRAAGRDAAVPRVGDGWFQPTHAVYRASAMADACELALAEGNHKIIEPLFALDYVVLGEDEVCEHASLDTFENINTPEEFAHAAERLG
ncbi:MULTISPECIES: molybdenum cofactor guanylyltransferase [Haloferax]|uniref:Probable molybdenum cofactor guanylyltransferase n=1 Tax=Haloferax massiliensis TaxID=1476858 RepID=A0A0D6JV34_9EURY|nr:MULTISPECIES: molybdenum cofactor guanylyltransferase [Haloferax]MDS0241436.1 molybdenum cofactor guanylyltransferase [Haloferax sp. S2CR25]MDS0444557.1 molybdenum cofactor guanylyltransferase [Haloferax sp. S2CR25-2]CQR52104.1 Molybdenum cofactor guanylyltransferase [Haloferax massiliensis]